jgi:hypothetical protein
MPKRKRPKLENLNTGLRRPIIKLDDVNDVSVYFDPMQMVATLCKLISGSKKVVGCVAWLTHPEVLSALEKTDSTIVMTKHRSNRWKRRIKVKFLGKNRLLMHHKFLVGFDSAGPAWVSLGSFNVTKSAVSNLENMLVFKDRRLADVFSKEFNRLI